MQTHSTPTSFSVEQVERFWAKADRSGGPDACWIWQAAMQNSGYGKINIKLGDRERMLLAHRAAWMIANGPIPEGMVVMHDCPDGDNKRCVNPRHLRLGTSLDNSRDAVAKGQLPSGERHFMYGRSDLCSWVINPESHGRGETHPNARLTEARVREIRSLKRAGHSYLDLAQRFGVHKSTIKDIVARRSWDHIKDDAA